MKSKAAQEAVKGIQRDLVESRPAKRPRRIIAT
jgi:hypothetical protein